MPSDDEKKPKIVSDENWKAQARQEKEKLSGQSKQSAQPDHSAQPAQPDSSPSAPDDSEQDQTPDEQQPVGIPPASFMTLINSYVIQTYYCLGKFADPEKGEKPEVNLDLAKHHIDMLDVLEEKTKGNLTEQEKKVLSVALNETRMMYVQAAQG
ncbi:MAG: DUF1844 domain-containing protein [Sedimentisphaerales bacterium]|nr:DUF1844 domain-containing protein [Sedimentisphaerales bacterium]